MYLERILIENNGRIEWLTQTLEMSDDGNPKPVIFVGTNGSGKTNLLSIAADALFETAAVAFDNVLPSRGQKRLYFRTLGGRNVRTGTKGSVALLQFAHGDKKILYTEKAGDVDPANLKTRSPSEFHSQIHWQSDASLKSIDVQENLVEEIFEKGIYCFFPSDRAEVPYWQNPENGLETRFSLDPKYTGNLDKPIYVDRAIADFAQWLISLLSDCRTELAPPSAPNANWTFVGQPQLALISNKGLGICNKVLQIIMDDPAVSFRWLGRRSNQKVGIQKGGILALPDLGALSAGQSILLGLFGTLVRYADMSDKRLDIDTESISGICIIDEIDSHIHLDLQYRAIPQLMKLFPKVQFICSSHSPVFLLGMEREFGFRGSQILRLPDGVPVAAETFSEFFAALEIIKATATFDGVVLEELKNNDAKILVYLEGETDPQYFETAATALGRASVLEKFAFKWIGAKDKNGRAFNTGKDALRHARNLLIANPHLAQNHVVLLGDNDTNFSPEDSDKIHVRCLPSNSDNDKIRNGIENLFPVSVFLEEFFVERTTDKGNGEIVTIRSLNKTALCEFLCRECDPVAFAGFGKVFDLLEDLAGSSNVEGAN